MHRLLIAAASAALLASTASVALADQYPPCLHPGQDSCHEVPHNFGPHHRFRHHPTPPPPPHHPHAPPHHPTLGNHPPHL